MSSVVAATSLLTLGAVTTTAVLGAIVFSPVILSVLFASVAVTAAVSLVMFTCRIGIVSTKNGKIDKKTITRQRLKQRERVRGLLDVDAASFMRKEDLERLEQRAETIRLKRQQEMQQRVDRHLKDAQNAREEMDVEQGLRELESFPTMDLLAPFRTDAPQLSSPPPSPPKPEEAEEPKVLPSSPLGLVRVNGRITSNPSLSEPISQPELQSASSWETESDPPVLSSPASPASAPAPIAHHPKRPVRRRQRRRPKSSSLRYAVDSPKSKNAATP